MTGTILSAYVAFLLHSGASLPAPKAPAKKASTRPAPASIVVVEEERRSARPIAVAEHSIGAPIVISDATTIRVAEATDAEAVVDEVQEFYKDIKQVTAKFRQTVKNATFGKTTTSDGKVWIKKPGKMRWDYYSKKKKKKGKSVVDTLKTFISNGTYLYVIEHQNKQVIEKNLEKNMLPVAVTFLYGKGDLKKDFDAKIDSTGTYGEKGDIVLELTPKSVSTQYKTLYLVVDKGNYRVKESVIIDGSKNVNHFKFYEPDFEASVKDSLFVFNKKKVPNYRITSDDDEDTDAKKDKE